MAKPGNQDWLRLQRKIFSRWVNQKVFSTRNIKVDDIVEAGADGMCYFSLMFWTAILVRLVPVRVAEVFL